MLKSQLYQFRWLFFVFKYLIIVDVIMLGTPGFTSYKEKFTKIDDEKRLKEVDLIEGAFLDLGFSFYQVRIEIIEKEANSSIIKSTVLYELNEEFASNASLITTERLEAIAQVFGKYLTEKNANACNS